MKERGWYLHFPTVQLVARRFKRLPAVVGPVMPKPSDQNDTLSDLTPSEYYVVLRKAVQDGIVGAVGTIILVLVSLYLIFFGVIIAVSGGGSSPVQAAGGILTSSPR